MRRLAVCVVLALTGGAWAQEAAQVSAPLSYSGYSKPEYASFKTFSEYVIVSDGVRLAIDVHLPAQGPERTSFPVVFEFTPYQRSTIDPVSGQVSDATGTSEGKYLLSYGYALVRADMRGTGASTGWLMDFMWRLSKDGEQLLDWIAQQPWCDGHIGMMGSSYLGWTQVATGARGHRALKCIVPECVPLDGYTGEAYPGGILLDGFFKRFSPYMHMIDRNEYHPERGIRPAKPVVDEDKDGELKDEIPTDPNGNGTFLDDAHPPVYADGQPRTGLYFQATSEHDKGNYDYAEWVSIRPFIDSVTPMGHTMYNLSPSFYVPALMRSAVPIYHWGGWFDAFARGTCELYCTLTKTNPSKLLMAPSYHDFNSGPFWKHFGIDQATVEQMYLVEHLRFFDRYLKEIQNGIDKEPPILLYVMNGGGWRPETEWPLKRQRLTKFYFDANKALTPARGADGTDVYQATLSHDSSYGEKKGNRYLGITGDTPETIPVRTDKDAQCLVYASSPFPADTEVTGHPLLHFWASSTTPDADFFIYLEDVDPAGQAVLVTEGQLRAGFAGMVDNNLMILAGKYPVDVLPDLPWHGFHKQQYVPTVFADNAIVELTLDFNPTSWVFKQGHGIRVSIACADYPTFRLNPAVSPQNKPDAPDNAPPAVTVYRDAIHPSHVELPVIPPSTK